MQETISCLGAKVIEGMFLPYRFPIRIHAFLARFGQWFPSKMHSPLADLQPQGGDKRVPDKNIVAPPLQPVSSY
jgi:hypothetical protein